MRVIAAMLGVPEEDGALFRLWIHEVLELGITDPAAAMRGISASQRYFAAEMEKRRTAPRDDLITHLANAQIDGKPVDPDRLIAMMRLLLVAGIDTTWSAIGACFWHLAQHPEDRRRLVAEPELIPTAVEEFLRAYAPVTMARDVVKETTINGCPFKAGRDGAALVPGGEPRSGHVPGCRSRGDRPQGEPPRGVRAWHPPLHRLESGAHGDRRRAAGMAAAHSRTSGSTRPRR